MENLTLPLFPLSLVVFPGSKYPLHIFEERYKRMLRRCRENGERFGIVAQIGKEISKIGTEVAVSQVLKDYENGESDIVVQGIGRIIILEYHQHPDGYFEALTQNYEDLSQNSVNEFDVEELKNKFKDIIGRINFEIEDSFWVNYMKNPNKSFKIAEKSGLSLTQQQKLLTLQDENERISFLREHLEHLEKKIDKSATMKGIILGDGYINN